MKTEHVNHPVALKELKKISFSLLYLILPQFTSLMFTLKMHLKQYILLLYVMSMYIYNGIYTILAHYIPTYYFTKRPLSLYVNCRPVR